VQTDATLERIVRLACRALNLPWLWLCGPNGEVLAGARPLELQAHKLYPLEHPDWGVLGELGLSSDPSPDSDAPDLTVLEAEILELCTLLTDLLAQQQAGLWSRSTLEHSPQPSFATDLEGKVKRFNPAALSLFRLSAEEVQGQLFERIPALSSPRLDVAFSEACSGLEVRPLELPCFRSDGTVALLRFSLAPLLDASKRLRGVVFCADDLLASLEDSGERESLRRLYAEVLDHLPLELILLDAEERVIYLNPHTVPDARVRRSFQGVFRENVSRALGRSESQLEDWRARYAEVKRTLRRTQWEETVQGPQGPRHLLRSIQPILSPERKIEMFVSFTLDLSEQKQAQLEREEALTLFQSLFAHATEGIYRVDATGQLLWANPALVRFNGCSSEAELRAAMGENPGSWYVQPQRYAEFVRLLETEAGVMGLESEVQLALSGERRWIMESARAVRDASGHTLYLEGTIQDITARKQAEAELRGEKALLEQIFNTSPNPIFVRDASGALILVNAALRNINTQSTDEFWSEPGTGHPDNVRERAEWLEHDREVLARGEVMTFEDHFTRPSGEVRTFSTVRAPLRREDGTVQVLGMCTDITALKRNTERLSFIERAVEASSDSISISDAHGEVIYLNSAAQRNFGYTLEQLREYAQHEYAQHEYAQHEYAQHEYAQQGIGLIPPEIIPHVHQAFAQNEPFQGETTVRGAGGQTVPVLMRLDQMRGAGGEAIGVVAVVTDITERKRMEDELRLIRRAFESSSDAILITDEAFRPLFINAASQAQTGYGIEALQAGALTRFSSSELGLEIMRALTETDVYFGEGEVQHLEGHRVPVLMRGNRIRGSAGQVLGSVMVATDISERKRIERLKDDFVATVSHELRTPLTSISGALGLLVAGVLGQVSEEQRPMLDIAHQNAERLIALVSDLLDMQKMEGEGLSLNVKPLELRGVLEQALAEIGPYARTLGVSLSLELASESGRETARVSGDSGRLAQVMSNLLSNACKFSSAGGSVSVRRLERTHTVRVEVEDRGTGIPEAFRGQIFGKFAQADASSTRSKGGTGLGLAISRAIVERHGGQIGFEPLEVGTLFYFELPLLEG